MVDISVWAKEVDYNIRNHSLNYCAIKKAPSVGGMSEYSHVVTLQSCQQRAPALTYVQLLPAHPSTIEQPELSVMPHS